MKIRKVTIKNLNSLRLTTAIDFEGEALRHAGLFAITGDTGAGKTTILDAMTLALYGRVHRNKDVQEVMSYGAAESLAEVEFDKGEDRYLARWMLWRAHNKADGNIQPARREIVRWNPEKESFDEILAERVREVDQLVEEITGLDYDRFTRSVLLAQGDFAAFLQASERERSDLLERITGTEIYTRLSKMAFERSKKEGEELEDLQRRREALQILDEETVRELKSELEQYRSSIEKHRQQLDDCRSSLHWVQRRQELEKRLEKLGEDLQLLTAEKKEQTADLERLKQYENVRPLEPQLTRLDELLKGLAESKEEEEELAKQLVEAEKAIEAARATHQQKKAAFEKTRQTLSDQQPVFEQVIRLDATIQEKTKPLERIEAEIAEVEKELKRNEQAQQENARRQSELEELEKENTSWLSKHDYLKSLKDDFSGMEQLADRWQESHSQAIRFSAELKKLQKSCENKREKVAELREKEQEKKNALDDLQSSFQNSVPDNYATDRSGLLELMAGEIEQLNRRREGLRQLRTLSKEYRDLLRRQDQYEEELEDLSGQDLALNKRLMNALEVLEDLDKRLVYQQEIYRQQQMIANYEKDRQQLKAGDPCPLCLSRDHPFREEEVKPFVDQAKRDLDRITRQKEKAHQQYHLLLNEHHEIALKIEQLVGDEQIRKGRRQELQEQIEGYELRIVETLPLLEEKIQSLSHVELLDEKLQETEEQIEIKQRDRKALQKISRQLEESERAYHKLREELRQQEMALKLEEKELKTNTALEEGSRGTAEKAKDQLRSALADYPHSVGKVEEVRALMKGLRQDKNTFIEKEEELRQLEEQQKLKKQELVQGQKEAKKLERQLQAARAAQKEAVAELEEKREKRRALFGDRDPQQEREELTKAVEKHEEDLVKAEHQLKTAEQEYQRLQTLTKQNRDDQAKKQQQSEKLRRELEKAIGDLGLENLEALRSALLSESERKSLEAKRKNLEQRELQTRKALEEREQELIEHKESRTVEATETELREAVKTLEQKLGDLQQSSGATREQLAANEKRKEEAAVLLQKIATQQREYRRWAKLNDIIGSADGKKFRVFAQGLTLSRLVRLANVHLQSLNGRYVIRKQSDEDLGIEIIDTYQADNRRSMNTLSGGESFLVSLALALGLSDLAGQQTNIRSLFIDEGFGSLDENSLDLAISTLENLQAGGKTIGIISHVKELKERIAVQIQVKKKGTGFSEIQIVG